ncbi:MAG TPA: hypothetical protein VKE93_06750 [Candidatus Angelobacter sp.]|nr:hypothetical protein [Candidatus Angelobacter sp.]
MPEMTTIKRGIQSRRASLPHAMFVAGKTLVISFAKTAYALWLETTGLVFGFLTILGGSALVRQYRADHLADHTRFVIVTAFTLVCGWFTVFSFLKAKRTRK